MEYLDAVKIKRDQYLEHIEPFKSEGIPTDTIFFKTLTGCGATTLELDFARNSIIIEPNVPVIVGKCEKYNEKSSLVLGIYEGVTEEAINTYLNSDVINKKIIVTPESFYRIKEAIGPSIFLEYFLLFDECERTIQDVSYRSLITLPMHDFFLFKRKAFISATPLVPSDPRFNAYKFKKLALQPDYDYKEQITVLTTNNVLLTLQRYLQDNPRDRYFFFINSVDSIATVIKKLKVKDNSSIYCARESRKKLRLNDFKNVYTNLQNFKKYNFFTSRFYSAVDIEIELYKTNPTIIIITDLVFAKQSMIDPFSEAIQIAGRFRKPHSGKIAKEIVHITNVDSTLTSMKKEEVQQYLNEQHAVYKVIKRYELGATTRGAKDTLRQMLERMDYAKFLHQHSGAKNYYMVDNLIHEEKVKGYYQSRGNLLEAYRSSNHFLIHKDSLEETYEFSDNDRLETTNNSPLKSIKKIIATSLMNLTIPQKHSEFQISTELANLQFDFPNVMGPINQLGLEESRKLNFNLDAIKSKLSGMSKQTDMFGLMTYIQQNFIVGQSYSSRKIDSILRKGIKELNLIGMKASVKLLRKFCELSDRVYLGTDYIGNQMKGYKIIKFLDSPF